ncbi:uncharacterized protein DUF3667 [Mucilaginibacter gracilis]|uniref:Uncharacterized protein DUF3667 n=1 Tax=Mucilaginibacter gracilis TaxID=423350 RepID=A0A495J419_9SPHI|nr:DUF3667 domain-containing protein [Mucilaginibacter gracilis]RKR83128.1 uncharacterized protein DUF3667 [Mucilaginibacter gracilis]
MKKHYRHDNDCLNCGTELQGHFCHVCGQENLHVKEPFWHFLSHSISHYFHFDEKFFATLKPLLTQPGFLTQQYLEGRRTRFLHPVSMYIFVSIVYFIVIPTLHPKETEVLKTPAENSAPIVSAKGDSVKTVQTSKTVVKKPVNKAVKDTTDDDDDAGSAITKNVMSQPLVKKAMALDSLNKLYKQNPTSGLKKQIDSISATTTSTDEDIEAIAKTTKHTGFVRWLLNIGKAIRSPEFKKEFEHYQPKLYFVLMPLFAFFLMLNFRKNHRYYVEHIVFTIHFFTAFFIFETIVEPINHFVFHNSEIIELLRVAVVLWYSYRALRVFYERRRWVTIRKMITLGIFLAIAFSISYTIIGSIVYMLIE